MPETRASSTGGSLPHLPALDGLRGCAVLAVLLFHLGVGGISGGFLGVDAFFVLSGFLITSLLLAEVEGGGLSLRRFWGRRVRRLLPALLVVLVTVGAVSALVPDWTDPARLRVDGGAALLYVANWSFALRHEGYFDDPTPSPVLHTWSLGIEEQFYLLWPLVVLAVVGRARARRRGTSGVAVVALVGAAASTIALWVHSGAGEQARQYYGSDTRAVAVLLGCALAVPLAATAQGRSRPSAVGRRAASVLAVVAATGVLVAWSRVEGGDARVLAALLPVHALAVCAVVAGVVVAPRAPLARLLQAAPLTWAGRLSYGLYLWHWPVILLLTHARTGLQGGPLLLLRAGVSVLLAVASLRWVEEPVRRGRVLARARAWVPAAGVALAAAVLVTATAAAPAPPGPEDPLAQVTAAPPESVPSASARPGDLRPATSAPTTEGVDDGVLRVSVLGDSVALTIGQGLSAVTGADVQVRAHGQLGCGVLTDGPYEYFGDRAQVPSQCRDWRRTWAEAIAADAPDVVAVLVGRWEVMDREIEGHWSHIGEPSFDRYLRDALATAVETAGAAGHPVAVLTAPYYLRGERPDGGRWQEDDPARVDRFNALLREVAAQHSGVTVVELGRRTSASGTGYSRDVDGVRLRYDGVHFTRSGCRWLAPWLVPELRRVAGAST